MALQLVVDNTDHHNHVGNLMKAVYRAATQLPLPEAMADLLLNLDIESVEDDLRTALRMGITGRH